MTRIVELSTHLKTIGRGTGKDGERKPLSATAAAAYRACCAIACEREGVTHDYRRKRGLEASRIVLPNGAPAWAADRAKLWNAVELREQNKDKRARTKDKLNAKTARESMFAFPAELSPAGRLKAAQTIARHLADRHQVAVDFAIHLPGQTGDQRNNHCHMMFTTRRLTEAGLGVKAREWDGLKSGRDLAKGLRAFIAQVLNDELKAEGKDSIVFVEHRSYKARGGGKVATRHWGRAKTHAFRRKQARERTQWQAAERQAQTDRHGKERAAFKTRQEFSLQAKLGDIAAREKAGIEAIRAALKAQQAADAAPTGASRLFQRVTGQVMRADFEREARHAQRVQAADRQILELKASLRKERETYLAGQKRDHDALTDRHGREERQFRHALSARQEFDRAAEREARREEVRSLSRDREHGRGRTRDDEPGFSP